MSRLLAVAAVLLAGSATAQVRPQPGVGDPHIQTVLYDPNQVVLLEASPGYVLTLELAPDEHIETVAVGDSAAWQVTADKRGDRLFVKPPAAGTSTNMTVVTDARTYVFELQPAAPGSGAFIVQFRYAAPVPVLAQPAATQSVGRYRLSGVATLRPSAIDDDGSKTFIQWSADQPLPATFMIDAHGQETLVNGAVRDGRYVVDAVANRLVFRIDRKAAEARRVPSLAQH